MTIYVATLALGSRPKQRLTRLRAEKGTLGMKANVREWMFTLPKELPPWELESRWTLECLKSDCRGQNPMDWRFFYTIGNLLKRKCLKWARMKPFEHLKHKLWPKEGLGVKLTIWLPTTKSQESTHFPYVQVTCNISLKRSWRGLQLCFRPHLNRRFSRKVMGPQSRGSLNLGNFGTPTGSPGTKYHLDVGFMEK